MDEEALLIYCGNYDCMDCGKRYQVNDPNSWRPCSWALCHDCYPKERHVPQFYKTITYNAPLAFLP